VIGVAGPCPPDAAGRFAAASCVGGRRNAAQVELRRNYIKSARIPKAFDGYEILQLSDFHVEMSEGAIVRSSTLLQEIDYDVCVLTGDYRADAFGPHEAVLAGMSQLCAKLKQPIYGVLGNHDTVRMLPGLGQMGIRMLLNECDTMNRDDQCIFVAGIDDAHFYRADNIEKAASGIPSNAFSILLSHTPEIYQQAAHADFNVLLRIREATSIAVVCMTAISCSLRVLRTISRPLDRGA
jgi:uncharacterized protein